VAILQKNLRIQTLAAAVQASGVGRRRPSGTQRLLHEDDIAPAVEFPAGVAKGADVDEA